MTTITYTVPGMHCGHCEHAVKSSVSAVQGVESVDVDLETKLVTVRGTDLSDESLRAAIDDAGYDVAA
jgi:copper chaperone